MDQRASNFQPAGEVLKHLKQFLGTDKDSDPPEYSVSAEVQMQQNVQPSQSEKTFNDVDMSRLSDKYNMNHKFRGCFIILNHKNFDAELGVPLREGTEVDCESLKNTARMLGFETEHVEVFHDLTVSKILELVKRMADADHSDYDCLAIAVLTHGKDGDCLYAQDDTYHVDRLINPFLAKKCVTLAGKPKLIFVQACRGTKLMSGYALPSAVDDEDTVDSGPIDDDCSTQKLVIPNNADFLLAFSTVPGFYSWRNSAKGSYFIQALCKCFDEFGDALELMQIMTRVNQIVAYEFESDCKSKPEMHKKKQIPTIVTRLTRDVYFNLKL